MASPTKPRIRPGRPRAFNEDEALDAAMRVFWEKGYEGTSLTDLTQAMGINRPSMYAVFGDKEQLFRRAMERYASGPASYLRTALAQPTARGVIEKLLEGVLNLLTDPHHPQGCLSLQGALAGSTQAAPVICDLRQWRVQAQAEFRKRFERAREEGDLPPTMDPTDLAAYIATVLQGIGIQAANGSPHDELKRVAEMTLRTIGI